MVADTPSHITLRFPSGSLIRLAFNALEWSKLTKIHDVISTDSTVVNMDVYYERELPQAQRATAFHFLISNLGYFSIY